MRFGLRRGEFAQRFGSPWHNNPFSFTQVAIFNFFSVSNILTNIMPVKDDELGKAGKFTEILDACTGQLLVSFALYSVFKTCTLTFSRSSSLPSPLPSLSSLRKFSK